MRSKLNFLELQLVNITKQKESVNICIYIESMNRGNCPRNAYWERHLISNQQNTVFIATFAITIPLVLSTNILLLYALVKTKQLNTLLNLLVLILCLSACFISTIVMPLDILMFTKFRQDLNCTLELVASFIQQTGSHMYVNIIFVMALHRYIQARPSTIHQQKGIKKWLVSKRGTIILVAMSMIFALFHGIASCYCFGYYYNRTPNWIIKGIDMVLVVTILSLYVRLVLKIKQHVRSSMVVRMQKCNTDQKTMAVLDVKPAGKHVMIPAIKHSQKYLKKLETTVFLTVLSTVVCSLPFVITDALTSSYGDFQGQGKSSAPQFLRFFYFMSWCIAFWSTILNAVIIIYRNGKVKKLLYEGIILYLVKKYQAF